MSTPSEPSTTFSYPALRVRQTLKGPWIALFAAPATEIYRWAGIPQKTHIGDAETLGFQRAGDPKRIDALATFCKNDKNVFSNPILVARRSNAVGSASFVPAEELDSTRKHPPFLQSGILQVSVDNLHSLSLLELLVCLKDALEARHPTLRGRDLEPAFLDHLRDELTIEHHDAPTSPPDDEELTDEESDASDEDLTSAVTTESHIDEFWSDIASRIVLLKELIDAAPSAEERAAYLSRTEFLRYSRDQLLSYLTPVILVDGQHRLLGALRSLERRLETIESPDMADTENAVTDRMLALLSEDLSHAEIRTQIAEEFGRVLPVSLLLSEQPAEHVFQFIVVNQKAKPISPALLATITSTTLTDNELNSVTTRLEAADIGVHHSRAVNMVLSDKESPFYGLVDRGIRTGNAQPQNLLQHKVLGNIVTMFRELKDGKLHHDKKKDYAVFWATECLEMSKITDDWEDYGCYRNRRHYWESALWLVVFNRFWSNIRDRFGNIDNSNPNNYWGNPNQSNLFNMVSLTILAADFFRFLHGRGLGIDSEAHIDSLMEKWLRHVNDRYFSRKWDLKSVGLKKTNTGIQKQWSDLWVGYREDPKPNKRVPRADTYIKPYIK